jgi:hypothetical protein
MDDEMDLGLEVLPDEREPGGDHVIIQICEVTRVDFFYLRDAVTKPMYPWLLAEDVAIRY